MSKGVCVVAQNNSSCNYVYQAVNLAKSIKKFSSEENISIVTNDEIPAEYQDLFDKVIRIENDQTTFDEWRIANRKQIYFLSPYDETLVFDTDTLVLQDLSLLWQKLSNEDLYFTTEIRNHRGQKIDKDLIHRKTFIENDLPNIYSALFYFKKTTKNDEFFEMLSLIVDNFNQFAEILTPNQTQKFCSIDVSLAMCVKLLNVKLSKNKFDLIHMKAPLQGIPNIKNWSNSLFTFANSDGIFINNYKQNGVLHYVEDDFINDDIIEWLDD